MEGLVEGGVCGRALSVEKLRGSSDDMDDEVAVSVEVEATETLFAAVGGRRGCRPRSWLYLSINLRAAPKRP